MEKFKDKYRIQSTRMPGWDYSRGGKYYVTINTRNRICCFGDVINGEMRLNETGKIANDLWLEIPKHFNDTWLDEHIVMPNHIHGIIVMKRLFNPACNPAYNPACNPACNPAYNPACRDVALQRLHVPDIVPRIVPDIVPRIVPENVPVIVPENTPKNKTMSDISPTSGSLGVIIRSYKTECTKTFKQMIHSGWHGWQPRFHDEIIRNEKRLQQIRSYIRNNPKN